MRHIPEEELHAYLDQALSRAQAVEIESHLAGCARCRAERDGIAGLRDRTTALLATLAPRGAVQRPSWNELRRRHLALEARRANLLRGAVWAASLLAAIGLGYGAHSWRDATVVAAAPVRTPDPEVITPDAPATPITLVSAPSRRPARTPSRAAASHPVQGIETDSLDAAPSNPAGGVWRTETLERVIASGLTVPRVAGLPVLQIQIQEASNPVTTPVVAVEQQLQTGELVRTFAGPAQEVAALDRSAVASAGTSGASANAASLRIGNRMFLMTGRIPPDSLRALLARIPTQ
ncbi:MAG TPA: zf-HC2 domain-containing protein [Gemmatimonadales bacterium]|nr:zf-HC2 domain-containing protein [Gemmatimonadales bacterium]